MAIAYSQDLRVRAIKLIKKGVSITQVSRLLMISRPTLYRWLQQFDITGSTAPKPRVPPSQLAKIQWKKFEEFVEHHGDKTHA